MDVDIEVSDGTLHQPVAYPPGAEPELGPGWFESSRALRLGLSVVEWRIDPGEESTCIDDGA